jgi:prepilin signal peptidase PulO-like enzyme (type II secretory pathway)
VIEGSAWTALGLVLGVAAGGALAAWLAGKRILPGRRCPRCEASLSPVARFPFLSWFGATPRCRSCGLATARLHPALEAAFLLIGLAAVFMVPLPLAIFVAVGGWAALLVLIFAWRRFR